MQCILYYTVVVVVGVVVVVDVLQRQCNKIYVDS